MGVTLERKKREGLRECCSNSKQMMAIYIGKTGK